MTPAICSRAWASNTRKNWVSTFALRSASAAATSDRVAALCSATASCSSLARSRPTSGWAAAAVKVFVF